MSVARSDFSLLADIGCSVGQLIELLQSHDAKTLVVLPGQNAGYTGVVGVRAVELKLFCNRVADYGPHEVPQAGESPDVVAVALLPAG